MGAQPSYPFMGMKRLASASCPRFRRTSGLTESCSSACSAIDPPHVSMNGHILELPCATFAFRIALDRNIEVSADWATEDVLCVHMARHLPESIPKMPVDGEVEISDMGIRNPAVYRIFGEDQSVAHRRAASTVRRSAHPAKANIAENAHVASRDIGSPDAQARCVGEFPSYSRVALKTASPKRGIGIPSCRCRELREGVVFTASAGQAPTGFIQGDHRGATPPPCSLRTSANKRNIFG